MCECSVTIRAGNPRSSTAAPRGPGKRGGNALIGEKCCDAELHVRPVSSRSSIAIDAADAKGATACRLATLRTAPAGLRATSAIQSGIPPVNWLLIRQ